MFQRWVLWPIFTAIIGIAIGGSYGWAIHPCAVQYVHQQAEKQASYNACPALFEWIMGFVTATNVSAFGAVAVAVFTWLLWDSTHKLWQASERQIKLARSVAAVQARNTRRQLKLAEDTAEKQLRAYLHTDKGFLRNVNKPDEIPTAILHIKNTGQTPAYNVSQWVSIEANKFNAPPNFIYFHEDKPQIKSVVGPGNATTVIIALSKKLSANQWAEIAKGVAAIWLWGEIRYEDAFGRRRFSRFRYVLGGPHGLDPDGGFGVDDEGNESN